MKGIAIRDFVPEDMETALNYREESGRISFPGLRIDREKARGYIKEHAEKYPGTMKIAELGGKTIGFIRFHPEEDSFGGRGLIDMIFIDSGHRNMGVGKALMEAAEKWFASAGIGRVEAIITDTNAPSLSFFKSLGYGEKRTVVEKRINAASRP